MSRSGSTGSSDGEGRPALPIAVLVASVVALLIAFVLIAVRGDGRVSSVGAQLAPPTTMVLTEPTILRSTRAGVTQPADTFVPVVSTVLGDVAQHAPVLVAEPVRLRIERLAVDASIVPVGVQEDGALDVPVITDVGWYRHGPRPGEPGSTVLAGHVDGGGRRGVFFTLGTAEVDDLVEVEMSDGSMVHYRVTGRQQIAKADLPLEAIFASHGPPVLALITCGGSFDTLSRHYRDNIVVLAEPVA